MKFSHTVNYRLWSHAADTITELKKHYDAFKTTETILKESVNFPGDRKQAQTNNDSQIEFDRDKLHM